MAYAAPRYRFENGMLTSSATTVDTPLAVVCTPDELVQATEVAKAHGEELKVPPATQAAIAGFYDPEFLKGYHTPVDGDDILEEISDQFAHLEVPLGLLSKLLGLKGYALNFVIDDSGSMRSETDSLRRVAGPILMLRFRDRQDDMNRWMSRWEEAEDRLHTMMDVLLWIPTQEITVRFLNRRDIISITRDGRSPAELLALAHTQIENAFKKLPDGSTPIYSALSASFRAARGPTMHYLFTDGEPSDYGTDAVTALVLSRPTPANNPITFVSCTGDDDNTEWMKNLDEKGPWIAEVDDYEDERREVLKKQGPKLPYTRGLWLMCLLVGAINPDDLDCLDESSAPLTKYTLDLIMGRHVSDQEYRAYFNSHPGSYQYRPMYGRFYEEPGPTNRFVKPGIWSKCLSALFS